MQNFRHVVSTINSGKCNISDRKHSVEIKYYLTNQNAGNQLPNESRW